MQSSKGSEGLYSFIHLFIYHGIKKSHCEENSLISMVLVCLIRYLLMGNKVGMLVMKFILHMMNVQLKGLESGLVLPSTSMAAHAVDEVETVETEKIETVETASREVDKVAAYEIPGLPLPPPPPPPHPRNAYSQVHLYC